MAFFTIASASPVVPRSESARAWNENRPTDSETRNANNLFMSSPRRLGLRKGSAPLSTTCAAANCQKCHKYPNAPLIIRAMEADRLNSIENTLHDLAARAVELRRYL